MTASHFPDTLIEPHEVRLNDPPSPRWPKRGTQDVARTAVILDRLYEGKTLKEIGDELGLTRERVRQLAAREGVSAKEVRPRRRKSIKRAAERSVLAEERRRAVHRRQKARRREIVAKVKELARELGRTPTMLEISTQCRVHPVEIWRLFSGRVGVGSNRTGTHFGKIGYHRFCRAVGLQPRSRGAKGHVR